MSPSPAVSHHVGAGTAGTRVARLLDRALVALAAGDRRTILELVRDHPGALGAMAEHLGVSRQAVSQDLSLFHSLHYEEQLEAMTARYDEPLLAAAGLEVDARVLDLGCGPGSSTLAAARTAPQGSVLGVDLSAAMVERGRQRSRVQRLANVRFERADAEVHPFEPGAFDVAVSRFGAMYFSHPVAAFANVGRALRPGGRLALVAWRDVERNEWMTAVRDALAQGRTLPERPRGVPGAFGLAEEDAVRRILAEAGFAGIGLEEVDRPVSFGPDAQRAHALVSTQGLARDLLDGLDATARTAALGRLRAALAAHDGPEGVVFGSSCWIITAHRP